jgi:glucose-6-phosphate dehydrogenase assembly protein OpcA
MLAAALDQKHSAIISAVVEGEACNPSSELLAMWLAERLKVPVERRVSDGPGLTSVALATADGDIRLDRPDGVMAELAVPGQPERHVALRRRSTAELMAEELRRLDPDEAYANAVKFGVQRIVGVPSGPAAGGAGPQECRPVQAAPAKKAAPGGKATAKAAAAKPGAEESK